MTSLIFCSKFVSLFIVIMEALENGSIIIGRLLEFTSSKEMSSHEVNMVGDRIIEKIKDGSLPFSEHAERLEKLIDSKIKELALAKILTSSDQPNYERDLKIMSCISRSSLRLATPLKMADRVKMKKNEQKSKKKQQDEQMKRIFMMKMKEWQAEKAQIIKRKKRNEQKQKSLDVSAEEQKKKEQKDEEDFLQLFKKKSIEGKIREISKRKQQRSIQRLHSSEIKEKSMERHDYKYLKAKENDNIEEAKRQQQNKKLLYERSKSLELKINEIVQHEKAFINKIKERLKMKPQNSRIIESNSSKNKIIDSFNLHKKDPEKMRQIKEKVRRMKEMQEKVHSMPLKISEQKKKEKEIVSDKLKNRKKYHFLSQKALRDSQIYEEFKHFEINIDKKSVGNHYLEEFKLQNRGKIQSQELISINKASSRDDRQGKVVKKRIILNPDQLDIIARRISKRKSFEIDEYPLSKSKKLQQQIKERTKTKSVHNFVNKQF